MPRMLTVATLQSAYGADRGANIARTADLIRQAGVRSVGLL